MFFEQPANSRLADVGSLNLSNRFDQYLIKESLLSCGLTQCSVPIEVRRQPTLKSFSVEYRAMSRVFVAHCREYVGEPPLQFRVKIGPCGEHAMVVCRRGPYL